MYYHFSMKLRCDRHKELFDASITVVAKSIGEAFLAAAREQVELGYDVADITFVKKADSLEDIYDNLNNV